jgi:acyl homoserine lactone synthase
MYRFTVGTRKTLTPDTFAALSVYRYEIFVRQLGWELPDSRPGCECDEFDTDAAVFVIAWNQQGEIRGCGRLLPTTQPYLLGKIFRSLLSAEAPMSPQVWELSRFAASPSTRGEARGLAARIFVKCLEVAHTIGATQVVGVMSLELERWCVDAQLPVERLGEPRPHGETLLVASSLSVPLPNPRECASLEPR